MRILLALKGGEQWVGDLHTRDDVNGNFVLSNPEHCASGKQFKGLQTFRDDEIDHVEDFKEEIKINSSPKEDKDNLSTKRRLNLVMDESPNGSEGIVIIDRLNDQFFKAAREISREKVIALAVEGRMLGRNGNLCCLQIKADTFVYIFDMMYQSDKFFQSGLKDIIEDHNILKIMHDCRYVSDALYHTYGISINNVYDTQVADIVIRKNNFRGKIPRHVRDLGTCLRDYLSLKPDVLSLFSAPRHLLEKDQLALMKRPFTDQVVEAAADSVRYLRQLRLETMQRLLKDLEAGIDLYLNHVRDSTPREIALMSANEVPEKMKLVLRGQRELLAPPQSAATDELSSLPDWTPFKTSQTCNPITATADYLERRMNSFEADDYPNETPEILNFSPNFLPQSLTNSPRDDAPSRPPSRPPSTAHVSPNFLPQSLTNSPRDDAPSRPPSTARVSPPSKPESMLLSHRKLNFPPSPTTKPKAESIKALKMVPAGIQQTGIPKNLAKWERMKLKDTT